MTQEQFTKFVSRLFVSFPSLYEWLKEKSPDPSGTQMVWRQTLETVSYTEAMSVLDRWTDGSLKAFSAFERDLVAVSIRAIVEQDRSRSTKRGVESKQQLEDAQKFRKDYSPVAPIFARAVELARSGSAAGVAKTSALNFPASAPYDGPRYKCFICCDRGRVEVWRNDLARAVDANLLSIDEAHGSYMVACACEAGTHYATENKYWSPMPRYQPDQYCRWFNGTIEDERARLSKWLAERKKHVEFAAWEG